jgi:hypothetical protein
MSTEFVNLERIHFTFPTKCYECREELPDDEARVCVVRAGSAWKDGVAFLEDGAVLYQTETYHVHHAPPEEARDD